MHTIQKPGHEPEERQDPALDEAASFGGPGWRPRQASHDQELAQGRYWHRCGYRSEVAELKELLLAWPGSEQEYESSPDSLLMLERPQLKLLQRQAASLARAYEHLGAKVHIVRPASPPPPNWLFMRDLFFATPAGAILARMASEQRAGEEQHMARALADMGVPIIAMPTGKATFEGADCLWLDESTLLLGIGVRTNRKGMELLGWLMESMGTSLIPIHLPRGVQHLLGLVNFIDRDLAALHGAMAPTRLRRLLEEHGVECIVLPPDRELLHGRSMNFVTISPRRLLMPADCPRTRARYQAHGVETHEVDISEYLKAAGGIGCLTGVLLRQ